MMAGILTVLIKNARFSYSSDLIGKMDPYLILRVGSEKRQTKIAEGAGRTATYNETFTFNISGENELKIEAFDRDTLTSDDDLGSKTVDFSSITRGGQMEDTVSLTGILGLFKKGEVDIKISFTPS